jgi:hypothetical protein
MRRGVIQEYACLLVLNLHLERVLKRHAAKPSRKCLRMADLSIVAFDARRFWLFKVRTARMPLILINTEEVFLEYLFARALQ